MAPTSPASRPGAALLSRACWILLAGGVLGLAALGSSPAAARAERATTRATRADAEAARRSCAGCHAFPPPDVLPRSSWRPAIHKMAALEAGQDMPSWGQAARPTPLGPDMEAALRYYEANAPAALPAPEPWPPPDASGIPFARHRLRFPEAIGPEPAVAHVVFTDLMGDDRLEVLVSDMRQGVVLIGRPYEPDAPLLPVAQVPNPDHAAVVDLDRDGAKDILVADLGGFLPADHDRGQVVWLRGLATGGFSPHAMGGFPRVADAEAADFDGDGRLDVLVAGFGWRKTGGITLLLNRTQDPRQPVFERRSLDGRAGPIHVVPVDLDRDGRLDFVTLVAQEHETVEAFLNRGGGDFRREVLYRAPHPNWGSSGIEVVDMDADGDADVLVTNGDMFDDWILKPYHGIRWLENRGAYPFVEHHLANLAGVHRALARDLDGDGDLDVVAAAFTPQGASLEAKLPSLVWLEQTRPGRFARRTLEVGRLTHATLDAADYDGDGDVDLAVGEFVEGAASETWLEIWENRRAAPPRAAPETGGRR